MHSHDNYDATADVFSMGIVISEVIAAKEADDIIDETRTHQFTLDVTRTIDTYCTTDHFPDAAVRQIVVQLVQLAGWCCALEPSDRPTTEQIVGRLQRIQLEYQAKHLRATSRSSGVASSATSGGGGGGGDGSLSRSGYASHSFLSTGLGDDDKDNPTIHNVFDHDVSLSCSMNDQLHATAITIDNSPHSLPLFLADPFEEHAASQVFEMFDQDDDGYLDYNETRSLAHVSDGYELTADGYHDLCSLVGAESSQGLSMEDVICLYAHLGIGDATKDLEKCRLHKSCGW